MYEKLCCAFKLRHSLTFVCMDDIVRYSTRSTICDLCLGDEVSSAEGRKRLLTPVKKVSSTFGRKAELRLAQI